MIDYISILELPEIVAGVLIVVFFVMQIVGEILELKGKSAPEILKIRKYFQRKKREREIIASLPKHFETIEKFNAMADSIQTINEHYSNDHIEQRNLWMNGVNDKLSNDRNKIDMLSNDVRNMSSRLDQIWVDDHKDKIIKFASEASNPDKRLTREQFNRIFKVYTEYEDFVKEHDLINGETDIAAKIIKEAYEKRLRDHSFIEDESGFEV